MLGTLTLTSLVYSSYRVITISACKALKAANYIIFHVTQPGHYCFLVSNCSKPCKCADHEFRYLFLYIFLLILYIVSEVATMQITGRKEIARRVANIPFYCPYFYCTHLLIVLSNVLIILLISPIVFPWYPSYTIKTHAIYWREQLNVQPFT